VFAGFAVRGDSTLGKTLKDSVLKREARFRVSLFLILVSRC
jgi:hypothetical protein